MFRSRSCPTIFEYLEELDFDEKFELSLFKTKSKKVLESIVPNLDFLSTLNIEKSNKSIENFILRQLQTDIEATNIIDFLEAASPTLGTISTPSSSRVPMQPPFIPTLPPQPNIADQKSTINSPPSTPSTSKIVSPLHTPPHTPHTSATPTPPSSPRPNPPRAMAARFTPLTLPQVLNDMPADYQHKIPLFDGTPQGITAQQHVDKMIDFFDLHEIGK